VDRYEHWCDWMALLSDEDQFRLKFHDEARVEKNGFIFFFCLFFSIVFSNRFFDGLAKYFATELVDIIPMGIFKQ
jgi:hypothetical protein